MQREAISRSRRIVWWLRLVQTLRELNPGRCYVYLVLISGFLHGCGLLSMDAISDNEKITEATDRNFLRA